MAALAAALADGFPDTSGAMAHHAAWALKWWRRHVAEASQWSIQVPSSVATAPQPRRRRALWLRCSGMLRARRLHSSAPGRQALGVSGSKSVMRWPGGPSDAVCQGHRQMILRMDGFEATKWRVERTRNLTGLGLASVIASRQIPLLPTWCGWGMPSMRQNEARIGLMKL